MVDPDVLGLRVVVGIAALLALDGGARALGLHGAMVSAWPAAWRAKTRTAREGSPYRADVERTWTLVAREGIPRATSLFLAPVFAVCLLWSLATVLALADLKDVVAGTRSLAFVLASLGLCAVNAVASLVVFFASIGRWTRGVFLGGLVALGLDASLYLHSVPCSDHRADDVWMAVASGVAIGALLLGYAVSVLRRRGTEADPSALRP